MGTWDGKGQAWASTPKKKLLDWDENLANFYGEKLTGFSVSAERVTFSFERSAPRAMKNVTVGRESRRFEAVDKPIFGEFQRVEIIKCRNFGSFSEAHFKVTTSDGAFVFKSVAEHGDRRVSFLFDVEVAAS